MTPLSDAERDRCGYPAGQEHPHVEQCHRAERERVLARVEALADERDDWLLEDHPKPWPAGTVYDALVSTTDLRALVASLRAEATP